MTTSYIDQALQNWYSLAVFQERYGSGWTALIAPSVADAAWVDGQVSGSDLGAGMMQMYLSEAGALFPVSQGSRTPSAALAALEDRLALVPAHARRAWQLKVQEAFEALRDAQRDYPRDEGFVAKALEAGELVRIELADLSR